MADHSAVPTNWWQRLLTLEPAVVRGAIGAIVALGLIWGLDLTDLGEKLTQTADVLGSLVALLTPLWVRQATSPAWLVEARVDSRGVTVAGPAAEVTTGTEVGVFPISRYGTDRDWPVVPLECETCSARARKTRDLSTHCVNVDDLDEDD